MAGKNIWQGKMTKEKWIEIEKMGIKNKQGRKRQGRKIMKGWNKK